MYRQLNDLGLATQSSQAQILQRLDELAGLRPPGDEVRDLRYRALFCGWAFEDAKAQLAYAEDGLARARRAANGEAEAGFPSCRATVLETLGQTEPVMPAYASRISLPRPFGTPPLPPR